MPKKYAKSLFLEFCQILLLCPNAKFELKGELETVSVSGPRKENLKRKAPPKILERIVLLEIWMLQISRVLTLYSVGAPP